MSDGINHHSDFAAVNVNCWTTPEEYIEEGTGGMIIWPIKPPSSWTSTGQYNGMTSIQAELLSNRTFTMHLNTTLRYLTEEVNDFVEDHEEQKFTVPYKANRCVIFDSAYIHATDKVRFGRGYISRRVNLTFLYGSVNQTCADAAAWRHVTSTAASLSRFESELLSRSE
jgi:hypothetical protein